MVPCQPTACLVVGHAHRGFRILKRTLNPEANGVLAYQDAQRHARGTVAEEPLGFAGGGVANTYRPPAAGVVLLAVPHPYPAPGGLDHQPPLGGVANGNPAPPIRGEGFEELPDPPPHAATTARGRIPRRSSPSRNPARWPPPHPPSPAPVRPSCGRIILFPDGALVAPPRLREASQKISHNARIYINKVELVAGGISALRAVRGRNRPP